MPRQVLEDTLTADSIAADTALAASGDGSAFERLYRTHVARVHTLVRRMLDTDEADDITQDVFIRAWQKLSTFRGESAFGTWLHRLAVNVILARCKAFPKGQDKCSCCTTWRGIATTKLRACSV